MQVAMGINELQRVVTPIAGDAPQCRAGFHLYGDQLFAEHGGILRWLDDGFPNERQWLSGSDVAEIRAYAATAATDCMAVRASGFSAPVDLFAGRGIARHVVLNGES